jgi:purine-binding chemotaxis protein CheW
MDASAELVDHAQYLTFHVAGAEYALPILQVKEILPYQAATPVPLTPSHVRGVINLRGSVVPVVDLAVKFGFSEIAVSKRTCVVIADVEVGEEQMVMGLVVDAVDAVIDLSAAEIEAPPSFGTGVCSDFLIGMGKVGDNLVSILDVDRVLGGDELLGAVALEEFHPVDETAIEVASTEDAGSNEEPR